MAVKVRHDLQHKVTRGTRAFSYEVMEKVLELLDVIEENTLDKSRFHVLRELLEEFVFLKVEARRVLNRFLYAFFAQVNVALGQIIFFHSCANVIQISLHVTDSF